MDSEDAGVPEELEVRANKNEETNESDANENPLLQVLPSHVTRSGSSPNSQTGPLVNEVSHEPPTPAEEPRGPQPVNTGLSKQANVLKYPVKTVELKLEDTSSFPAKTIPQKPADSPHISAKPVFKQTHIPNISAKPNTSKPDDTHKLSAKPISLTLPDTSKLSAQPIPFQGVGTSKLVPKPIPFKLADILKLAKPAPQHFNIFRFPEKKILKQDPQANTPSSSAKLKPSKLAFYTSKWVSKIRPLNLGKLFTSTASQPSKPNNILESSKETMASKQNEPPKLLAKPRTQGDVSVVSEDDKPSSLSTSSEATVTPKQGDTVPPSSIALPPKQGDLPKVFKPSMPKQGSISISSEDSLLPKPGDIPKAVGKSSMPKQESFSKSSEKATSPKPGELKTHIKPLVPKKQGSIPKPEEAFLPKLGDSAKHLLPKQDSTPKSSEESTLYKQEDIPKSSKESVTPVQENSRQSSEESTQPKREDTLTLSKEVVSAVESNILKTGGLENFLGSHVARVREILSKEDFQLALREAGDRLVAVDFSAQWCGPCRFMKPFFHSLSLKHDDVVFLEVDVDHCEELAQEQAIFAIPAFRFFKNEELVGEFGGAVKEKLEATIEKLK